MSEKPQSQNKDNIAALPEHLLAKLAARLVREGRMLLAGMLSDALAVRPVSGPAVKLSRAGEGGAPKPYHKVFVSSSEREGSTAEHAKAGLSSPAFHELILASHRLPGTAGGESGIGAWADGAEESRIVDVADPRRAPEIAARLGKRFNQKGVLSFTTDPSGTDIAHVLHVGGAGDTQDTSAIADTLQRHGIEYKTVTPGGDAHIIDNGGGLTPQVEAAAQELGASHEKHIGHARFYGGDTREAAQEAYDKILAHSPQFSPVM